jgi:hypothetical protein
MYTLKFYIYICICIVCKTVNLEVFYKATVITVSWSKLIYEDKRITIFRIFEEFCNLRSFHTHLKII